MANLRARVEELNGVAFTDAEWKRFSAEYIANPALTVVDKTRRIQDDPVIAFERDDGSVKNIYLLDREHIHRNRLQVMNQYEADTGVTQNRYDVTLLVNGLPLVHIELKRRGVRLREAFNQIERYQRESFWSGSGLFEFAQIFVISNGTRHEVLREHGALGPYASQAGGRRAASPRSSSRAGGRTRAIGGSPIWRGSRARSCREARC